MSVAAIAEGTSAFSWNVEDIGDVSLFENTVDARTGREWWVFYTKARQEKALARHLAARRVPYYLPLHEKFTLSRGRRLSSHVPLFPGYVFLFVDWEERITALESNRVSRTIAVAEGGQQQLEGDLRQICRVVASGVRLTLESRIQSGERIRIKSGRLAGLEGVVINRRGVSPRLLVAVNFVQQGASIEIDDFAVEVI